jgi:hypothetical protein
MECPMPLVEIVAGQTEPRNWVQKFLTARATAISTQEHSKEEKERREALPLLATKLRKVGGQVLEQTKADGKCLFYAVSEHIKHHTRKDRRKQISQNKMDLCTTFHLWLRALITNPTPLQQEKQILKKLQPNTIQSLKALYPTQATDDSEEKLVLTSYKGTEGDAIPFLLATLLQAHLVVFSYKGEASKWYSPLTTLNYSIDHQNETRNNRILYSRIMGMRRLVSKFEKLRDRPTIPIANHQSHYQAVSQQTEMRLGTPTPLKSMLIALGITIHSDQGTNSPDTTTHE